MPPNHATLSCRHKLRCYYSSADDPLRIQSLCIAPAPALMCFFTFIVSLLITCGRKVKPRPWLEIEYLSTKQATRQQIATAQSAHQFWKVVQPAHDLAVRGNRILTYQRRHDRYSFLALLEHSHILRGGGSGKVGDPALTS